VRLPPYFSRESHPALLGGRYIFKTRPLGCAGSEFYFDKIYNPVLGGDDINFAQARFPVAAYNLKSLLL
jgi:hypothetical protein